jgi:hypothetical protein
VVPADVDLSGSKTALEKNSAVAARNYENPGKAGNPADFAGGAAPGALFSSIRITV